MSRDRRSLFVIAAITSVAAVLTLAGIKQTLVQALFGLPLALFLPGYAFTLVFLKRELRWAERGLFSIGLSLAMSICFGFVLNTLPWGIQPNTWALLIGGATLTIAGWGVWRERGGSQLPTARFRLDLSVGQGALFVAALLLVGVAVSVARIGAAEPNTPGFTQLWLLPSSEISASQVRIGVHNAEERALTYRLQLDSNGNTIQEWPTIQLEPNQSWEQTFELPNLERSATIEASLYRQDAPTNVYRHVKLVPKTPALTGS